MKLFKLLTSALTLILLSFLTGCGESNDISSVTTESFATFSGTLTSQSTSNNLISKSILNNNYDGVEGIKYVSAIPTSGGNPIIIEINNNGEFALNLLDKNESYIFKLLDEFGLPQKELSFSNENSLVANVQENIEATIIVNGEENITLSQTGVVAKTTDGIDANIINTGLISSIKSILTANPDKGSYTENDTDGTISLDLVLDESETSDGAVIMQKAALTLSEEVTESVEVGDLEFGSTGIIVKSVDEKGAEISGVTPMQFDVSSASNALATIVVVADKAKEITEENKGKSATDFGNALKTEYGKTSEILEKIEKEEDARQAKGTKGATEGLTITFINTPSAYRGTTIYMHGELSEILAVSIDLSGRGVLKVSEAQLDAATLGTWGEGFAGDLNFVMSNTNDAAEWWKTENKIGVSTLGFGGTNRVKLSGTAEIDLSVEDDMDPESALTINFINAPSEYYSNVIYMHGELGNAIAVMIDASGNGTLKLSQGQLDAATLGTWGEAYAGDLNFVMSNTNDGAEWWKPENKIGVSTLGFGGTNRVKLSGTAEIDLSVEDDMDPESALTINFINAPSEYYSNVIYIHGELGNAIAVMIDASGNGTLKLSQGQLDAASLGTWGEGFAGDLNFVMSNTNDAAEWWKTENKIGVSTLGFGGTNRVKLSGTAEIDLSVEDDMDPESALTINFINAPSEYYSNVIYIHGELGNAIAVMIDASGNGTLKLSQGQLDAASLGTWGEGFAGDLNFVMSNTNDAAEWWKPENKIGVSTLGFGGTNRVKLSGTVEIDLSVEDDMDPESALTINFTNVSSDYYSNAIYIHGELGFGAGNSLPIMIDASGNGTLKLTQSQLDAVSGDWDGGDTTSLRFKLSSLNTDEWYNDELTANVDVSVNAGTITIDLDNYAPVASPF